MDHIFQLNSVGLLYDGVGVIALGFAFFLKSIRVMMIESGTYWGGNNALLESLIQQRTDGVVGTSLLVTGFFLQFLGSLGLRCESVGKTLAVALVVVTLGYILFLRKKLIALQVSRGEALRKEQDEEAKK